MDGLSDALVLAWDRLRGSFWFVPALMTLGAGVLAVLALSADLFYDTEDPPAFLFTGGPEAARAVLQAVASSTITVAGVVFSVTIAALSTTSQQYGPLLLRRFMRDPGNQVSLGTFIATFAYCLLVLRSVRNGDEGDPFVPHAAITIALLLALASVAVLIFFLHHVTGSMRASRIIEAAGEELDHAIRDTFPLLPPPPEAVTVRPEDGVDERRARGVTTVSSRQHGYIQQINVQALRRLAEERDATLLLRCAAGEYVMLGTPLVEVVPEQARWSELDDRVNEAIATDVEPTSLQDPAFAAQQLSQIVLRALSPSINDPYTAANAVSRLMASCAHLGHRYTPPHVYRDERGTVRLVARVQTAADVLHAILGPTGRVAAGEPALARQLMAGMGEIARTLRPDDAEAREMLHDAARMLLDEAQPHLRDDRARSALAAAAREALASPDALRR
ncbi:MAG: DUF2254 domain-containing protein [Dehalococcoidia bacterium]